ncbi:MAG: cytochrome c peroxidase [Myxococcota bacterium]
MPTARPPIPVPFGRWLGCSILLLLVACPATEESGPQGGAAAVGEQARSLFGVLPAEAASDANPVTDEKVELGRKLYYDARLSRNHDVSCNSCHPLDRFGADGEPTSPGHLGARGERNSPTVYNAAFHIAQFWDGRAADVEEQARGPIQNPVEMAMPSGEAAETVLRSIPGYAPLFRAAFPDDPDPVRLDNAVDAIGAFERRLVTPSRFDDFLGGDEGALTAEERHGLSVFLESGCTACHAGALLGGHMYQKLGLVKPFETEDPGRQAVTGNEADRHVFKVPSLRNVAETGPYFHDGSISTLDEAVHLMARHQVGRELPDEDVAAIGVFLASLTGRIDAELIARPELPPSGPDTPAADTSDPFAKPPRFAPPVPRAESGPVSESEAAGLIQQRCAGCHRFEGEPESKYRIAAPDLMWGGQKYRRDWLVGWLKGEEPSMYPGPYRWDRSDEPPLHPTVVDAEAEAIADYFQEHLRVPYVPEGAFDPATLTELEVRRGGELFREYSCIGCHQVMENGKPVGGPISTTFFDSGRRYDPDWVLAFNIEPPAFTPHSGEYEADVSERKVRWVTGYIMAQGVDDFAYAKPWEGAAFESADAGRGEQVYFEYCAQCHGLSGEGDGPGAAGLDPKPAAHARMAIHQLPDDYLYNVVYFGGKEVGKSSSMPDWGMTFDAQRVADVIAYMKETFQAEVAPAAAGGGECPQPRATRQAPDEALAMTNPLAPDEGHLEAGRKLYQEAAVPMACRFCHGESGDGLGPMAAGFDPPPRNFACAETMAPLADGQLFWIIRNGSPGTGMMAFPVLTDEQIWQLVLYVRSLAQ